MSVTFYHESGVMLGVDLHDYYIEGSPTAVPLWPYAVGINFYWPTLLTKKRHYGITMELEASYEGGVDFYLVPHVPLPLAPPNAALEIGEVMKIVALSGSKAWMQVHKVKLNGGNAATCTKLEFGSNQNCCAPFDNNALNMVWNLNSVRTEPTKGDYAGSAIGMLVDSALGWGVGELAKKAGEKRGGALTEEIIKQVWRHVPPLTEMATDNPTAKQLSDIPGTIAEHVQQSVDGELSSSADGGPS